MCRCRFCCRRPGVKAEASWLVAEGADACRLTRSVPLDKELGDTLVAYAQNGEAIRPAQGYPLRLLIPGWEGTSVSSGCGVSSSWIGLT